MRRIALIAATVVVLTALAPIDSGRLPWLGRAVWFLAGTVAWELSIGVATHWAGRRFGTSWGSSPFGFIATVVAASVPATSIIAVLQFLAGEWSGHPLAFYGRSLLLGLVIAFARRGLRRQSSSPAEAKPAPTPSGGGGVFLRRHAPMLTGRLIALQAEDHYLRIHSDAGSALVLMRLRDAVAELGEAAGWQPHRSFWLAADAGGRAVRRGQAWQIVLPTGLAVPVSKTAAPAMRAAGYGAQ